MSARTNGKPRARTGLWAATIGLYIGLLAISPFAHHDIACHLKSSTHCTTCAHASVTGDEARPLVVPPPAPVFVYLSLDASAKAVSVAVSAQGDRAPPLA